MTNTSHVVIRALRGKPGPCAGQGARVLGIAAAPCIRS